MAIGILLLLTGMGGGVAHCLLIEKLHRLAGYLEWIGRFQSNMLLVSSRREHSEHDLQELQRSLRQFHRSCEPQNVIGNAYLLLYKELEMHMDALRDGSVSPSETAEQEKFRDLSMTLTKVADRCMDRQNVIGRQAGWYFAACLTSFALFVLLAVCIYWYGYRCGVSRMALRLAGGTDGWERVTSLKELDEALQTYLEHTGQQTRGHEFFLAEMSHEIRTPLNGVIGFLSNLSATSLTPQQSQYVRIIESSARSLLHVINEVLDFSKLNSGGMELEDVAFDLRALAEDRLALANQLGKSKGLRTSLVFPWKESAIVRGDPNRLRQVLDNLLNNAVKFTESGDVCLEIQIGEVSERQLLVDIAVKDTGIGMTAEALKGLFEPFRQADSSVSRKFGGTGLGLCISSRLVELMGGKLEVWSRRGEGTRFYFMLQMTKARAEEQVRLAGSFRIELPRQDVKSHCALLVDDTPTNLFLLETVCQSIGLPYRTASNGLAAVELCKKQKFDVIFMDIQMPVMDGYTAIREIRALPTSSMTSIIALTASSFQEDVERSLSAGATGFIAKPFERNQLLMCISDALMIQPERKPLEDVDIQESEDESTIRHMYDFMREQYQLSLGEIKMTLVQTISDWRPLLDNLSVYAKKGTVSETCAILHRLKGQLSSIGLQAQSEQAAVIMEWLSSNEISPEALESIANLVKKLSRIFRLVERDVTPVHSA